VIIDAHFHVWPDAIARKALGRPAADLDRRGDGTEAGARATMERDGVGTATLIQRV
jgi:uncharacterized protein